MDIQTVGPWVLLGTGVIIAVGALRVKPAIFVPAVLIFALAFSGAGVYGEAFLERINALAIVIMRMYQATTPEEQVSAIEDMAGLIAAGKVSPDQVSVASSALVSFLGSQLVRDEVRDRALLVIDTSISEVPVDTPEYRSLQVVRLDAVAALQRVAVTDQAVAAVQRLSTDDAVAALQRLASTDEAVDDAIYYAIPGVSGQRASIFELSEVAGNLERHQQDLRVFWGQSNWLEITPPAPPLTPLLRP